MDYPSTIFIFGCGCNFFTPIIAIVTGLMLAFGIYWIIIESLHSNLKINSRYALSLKCIPFALILLYGAIKYWTFFGAWLVNDGSKMLGEGAAGYFFIWILESIGNKIKGKSAR